jgi:Ca2+-binding EF-hand superfamily protein
MNKIISGFIVASGIILTVPIASACEPGHAGRFETKIFAEMDANKDGVISKKEFDAFHNNHFKELDANHDGKITIEEFEAAHSAMQPDHCDEQHHGHDKEHGNAFISKRFEAADTNHDGAISREEAKSMPMILEHFDQIDANKDGKITEDEIKAMMKEHDAEPQHGKDEQIPEKK